MSEEPHLVRVTGDGPVMGLGHARLPARGAHGLIAQAQMFQGNTIRPVTYISCGVLITDEGAAGLGTHRGLSGIGKGCVLAKRLSQLSRVLSAGS